MSNIKRKIGIIGCGTIGTSLADFCIHKMKSECEIVAVFDEMPEAAVRLKKKSKKIKLCRSIDELVKKSDFIVESASKSVSAEILKKCIIFKKDLLIMSIGGLVGSIKLIEKARKKNINLYLPSGAIAGIDGIKSASVAKIKKVRIVTKKPIKGLRGAPYFIKKGIKIEDIKKEKTVFKGTAAEAIKYFPKNVNVSALLSIAGIGAKKTQVEIRTSPEFTKNMHEITVEGDFGTIRSQTINVPSRNNPKTSSLAIFSAIATLKQAMQSVKIGT